MSRTWLKNVYELSIGGVKNSANKSTVLCMRVYNSYQSCLKPSVFTLFNSRFVTMISTTKKRLLYLLERQLYLFSTAPTITTIILKNLFSINIKERD